MQVGQVKRVSILVIVVSAAVGVAASEGGTMNGEAGRLMAAEEDGEGVLALAFSCTIPHNPHLLEEGRLEKPQTLQTQAFVAGCRTASSPANAGVLIRSEEVLAIGAPDAMAPAEACDKESPSNKVIFGLDFKKPAQYSV